MEAPRRRGSAPGGTIDPAIFGAPSSRLSLDVYRVLLEFGMLLSYARSDFPLANGRPRQTGPTSSSSVVTGQVSHGGAVLASPDP